MITYKIKYKVSEEGASFIERCRKQYTSLVHYGYNRVLDGYSLNQIRDAMKTFLNNVELMDSHMVSCAAREAIALRKSESKGERRIFGGKKNFIKRCKGLITREEFLAKRLVPMTSIGETNQKANRKFRINQDLGSITFQINKSNHYTLELIGVYGKRKDTLSKLYALQESKNIPITYQIDDQYIYLTFDEVKVEYYKRERFVKDRVMAIDLNPNYVGWSIVDWKGESEFEVIKQGVFSIEKINAKAESLIKKKTDSSDPEKIYINNKREYESYHISKKLIDYCLYYQCESFCVENLDIRSKDAEKGKQFNRLVNNNWNRDKLILNLQKRCNIFDVKFLKVLPNFSSFVGNILYRNLRLPDMVLASIEIGRRGYEFNLQYIEKSKERKRNIIFPDLKVSKFSYSESLEEFGLSEDLGLRDMYYVLKKSKTRYRLSLFDLGTEFSSCFSHKSLILKNFN